MVPEWEVGELGNTIRQCLQDNGCDWADGILFLHQVRGVKHSSSHAPTEEHATSALREFLEECSLLVHSMDEGSWWIDVGIEIASDDGNCLTWRTDSHFHVVREAMGVDDHVAKRITSPGSSQYTRDMVSHLPKCSSFRIAPGARARGRHQTQYIQAYPTDKSITYRHDHGHYGKFLSGKKVLTGKHDDFIESLYGLYGNAISHVKALARLEMRVPILHADAVLLNLGEELLRDSLVSFHRSVWW